MQTEEKIKSLSELSERIGQIESLIGTLRCQLVSTKESTTRNGSFFLDIEIADHSGNKKIKIWQESQAYASFLTLPKNAFVEFSATFRNSSYGLQAIVHTLRVLSQEEIQELLEQNRNAEIQSDWELLEKKIGSIADPRLCRLCSQFLIDYGERFKRAAAAREYHHNFRGGLLRHVCQMIQAAEGLMAAYPVYNWDLIKAGILFHDCGKLWENDFQEQGFVMKRSKTAELIGHIPIGVEIVNSLWRSLQHSEEFHRALIPPSDLVRVHLLHLIVSHHGLREYGSPVTPRTPEAWILHILDNLDAKLEMFRCAYEEGKEVVPGIFERRPPLEGYPIAPLSKYISKPKSLEQTEGTSPENLID
ncbi:hydrolase [Methylacidiphilum sp. Yel]|uniref:HD domain-containing protein n=1 Tax=Methylacidiphilum sp. Yel TaxID=1847730 RepID=UPI00106D4F30|nr:HD domain-containing protein [Methylacidiphilum sp. Yel]TFE65742.1 hydrolase [Methylacidiphilum sp. Yel]